jgi:hypothetical protein
LNAISSPEELRARTKEFAIRIIKLFRALPKTEEADETAFWLELLVDANILKKDRLESLLIQADELVRIFQASRTTARNHAEKSPIINRKSPIHHDTRIAEAINGTNQSR